MAAKKSENVYGDRLISPLGRFSYPYVFERAKNLNDPSKEGKFEVTLLIPKKTDISALIAAVEKVGAQAFGAKWKGQDKQTHPTIRDGDEKDDEYSKGHWVIRAKTTKRPGVVDAQKRPIEDKDEVYGGCWGRISVVPGSYQQLGNWGVTLYLNNVQKVRDDEAFGGGGAKAEDDFSEYQDAAASADDL
jgi:hypothetical protein